MVWSLARNPIGGKETLNPKSEKWNCFWSNIKPRSLPEESACDKTFKATVRWVSAGSESQEEDETITVYCSQKEINELQYV